MSTVDSLIAIRIVQLLITPFDKWKACDEGFITPDGARTDKQGTSDNWTMLHRLVWRLKLLLGKIPGGSSSLGTMTAAYLLVKEQYENDKADENITESEFLSYKRQAKISFSDYALISSLLEEAPANVSSNVAGTDEDPPVRLNKLKRKKVKNGSVIVP